MASEDSTPINKKATAKKKATAAPRKKASSTRNPAAKKTSVSKKTTAPRIVKKAATKKTAAKKAPIRTARRKVSAEQRREMIATMAYYRAQARGFKGDTETEKEDWLESERAVDQLLKGV